MMYDVYSVDGDDDDDNEKHVQICEEDFVFLNN
jgi:hypothetical protein